MRVILRKLLFFNGFRGVVAHSFAGGALEWNNLMCHNDTRSGKDARLRCVSRIVIGGLVWGALLGVPAPAQGPAGIQPDWRHIGSTALDLALASPASGPVARGWYSPDGARLFVRTSDGRVFETADFEKWQPGTAVPPPDAPAAAQPPSGGRSVRISPTDPARLYAYGGQVFRSDDGGRSWANVTSFGRRSIIGGEVADLAVSPLDAEDVV